eukprot:403359274
MLKQYFLIKRNFIQVKYFSSTQGIHDPYKTLGVNQFSSQDDVKEAFRKLAQRYHPDRQDGNKQKFLEIKSSYDYVISKINENQVAEVDFQASSSTTKTEEEESKNQALKMEALERIRQRIYEEAEIKIIKALQALYQLIYLKRTWRNMINFSDNKRNQKFKNISQNLSKNKRMKRETMLKNEGVINQGDDQTSEDYSQMRTLVNIPYEAAPQDPVWMTKRQAGKKLNSQEMRQYMEYQYEKSLKDLQNKNLMVPSRATFVKVVDETHSKKHDCLISHSCAGKNYTVYDGVFDRCGKMSPFVVWDKYVTSKKYSPDLNHFMEHYNIPAYCCPEKASMTMNAFFQAKYGMFYCYDNNKRYGLIDFDPELINRWERSSKNVQRTWSLAVMSAISEGTLSFEDIKQYKIDFTKWKKWEAYLQRKSHRDSGSGATSKMKKPSNKSYS